MKRPMLDLRYLDRLVRELLANAAVGFIVLAVFITLMSALMRFNESFIGRLRETPVKEVTAKPQLLSVTPTSSMTLQHPILINRIAPIEPLPEIATAIEVEPLVLVSSETAEPEEGVEVDETGDEQPDEEKPEKDKPKKEKPDHKKI